MFAILERLDSVDALPDKKGRVKLDFRKKHAEVLHDFRPNLYSGGIYFVRKQNYELAYQFFDEYINCATIPLFSSYHYLEKDKTLPSAAYWAVYCGYKLRDPKATLHHSYIALKDSSNYCLMLQYLAETYYMENDTVRYFKTIEEGFKKYPTFPYFFPRLIEYYSTRSEHDKALRICDEALAVDSLNQNFLFAQSTLLLNTSQYDKCLDVCNRFIALNDSFPDVYLNAGLAYYNQAVEIDKNYKIARRQHGKVMQLYKNALRYFEKYRILAPEQKNKWALPLYTIYLNLNMGKEFDTIDQILRNMEK
ncbi:tetratricopeptide repeat protein [Prevotella sp.]|uniref:tetratricopeptide repeat protein n=1 Tax=Prevotella sp. TaxID=59823 RepID=UPI002F93B939